jgi:lipoyl(octanoyl) transferase
MITVELLPYQVASGPQNMAADEAMLESATQGRALLRFYEWTTATVSLGYFQSHHVLKQDRRLAALPFVRRPTGGATLVHHHELTYAVALPQELAGLSVSSWLMRVHQIIANTLARSGVNTETPLPTRPHGSPSHTLCFHQHASVDLLIGQAKVLGSAQRKHKGALMQHGSILLAQSEHTPSLPGILELTGKDVRPQQLVAAIAEEWPGATGWNIKASEWTAEERKRIEDLSHEKYGDASWNLKR